MRLIIPDIPEEGLNQELDLPVMLKNSKTPDIAHAVLKISRFKKTVLIKGSINIKVSLICGRCCSGFEQALNNITFSEEYNPAGEIGQENEQELTDKELDLSYYNNDEIDLNELIKEQVLLSVPMKPLCSDDCRGLCVTCGKELNSGPCQCKADSIDPRLAPLQQLKESMENKKTS